MRLTTLAIAALAALPASVSAKGILGFSLGTQRADGSCKVTSDYEADFDAISAASGSKLVRGYAASNCHNAQQILPAAKAKGFQVMLGVWPDTTSSFNDDVAALKASVPNYPDQVYAITVGSEALYRGDMTAQQLLSSIQAVQKLFPNQKIGTADSWNKYADGTADPLVQAGVGLFMSNAFAYWQGAPINNASHVFLDDTFQAFTQIQKVAAAAKKPAPELWVGEVGWPTDGGTNYGSAIASTSNANTFYHSGVCGLLDWDYNLFYFEAFDEPWKPDSVGDNGSSQDEKHWGAMTSTRQPKFSLKC